MRPVPPAALRPATLFPAALFPAALLSVTLLAGCAQVPIAPSVQVMPGPGKSYAQFQNDQSQCVAQASYATQGHVQASNNRAVGAAVLTTALGAGLGAAAGGGRGAGIGAAAGGVAGAGIAGDMSANDQYDIQRLYDNTFGQCMYARGHQVEGFGPVVETSARPAGPDPALVRAVQAELQRLGYIGEPPDGQFGPNTQAAIRNFEQANGLAVSGYPTQRVLARLQASTSGSGGAASGWVAPSRPNASTGTGTGGAAAMPPAGQSPSSGWVQPSR